MDKATSVVMTVMALVLAGVGGWVVFITPNPPAAIEEWVAFVGGVLALFLGGFLLDVAWTRKGR